MGSSDHHLARGETVVRIMLALTLLISSACLSLAQEVGDTIVVTAPQAQLRRQTGDVGKVPRGNQLVVEVVNGNWFWVPWESTKGWIHRKDVIRSNDAMAYFTRAIRSNPNAGDYNIRGTLWESQGDQQKAAADYAEAIRLDPRFPSPYENRGLLYAANGDYQRALADFNRALELDPQSAVTHYHRSNVQYALGKYEQSVADYERAIALDPQFIDALNGFAWLLATTADEKYRNGQRAVELATKAVELTRHTDASSLDTLAAAYAESGDFENAIKTQEQAIELADDEQKADYQSRLEQYRAGKPYHETAQP